ncbi:MAG: SURF1 family protein, partial [Methylococcaceae bacterium]|nr:SURF1 family protein [Methylococcaceae bacterium]
MSTGAALQLRFGRYRLRAGLWPTLATLTLLPLLTGLGFWQLERAAGKQRLQAEFDQRQQDTAVGLGGELQDAELLRFRRVRVRGDYEPAYQILIDNRVHQGRAGYHVLTPLRLGASDMRVLVNRGWVPVGPDRRVLPAVPPPEGEVEVDGIATVPATGGFRLGAAQPAAPGWQARWQYVDLDAYAASVPFPVQPVVVLLDHDSPAGGYTRQWARLDSGIATHQGYAFQWFSLAV